MMAALYEHKKDLKASVGKALNFCETSLFGPEYTANGILYVVGPTANNRKWYAQVTMKDDLIEKVE